MSDPKTELSYILNHLGEDRETYFNAVVPPLVQTSNFAFQTVDAFAEAIADESTSIIYSRGNNPTVMQLNTKLAALEGTDTAITLASGSAAIATAVISQVKKGDHVVCIQHPYTWTFRLLDQLLGRFGVSYTLVDGRDLAQVEEAINDQTKLIFLESPNSMMMELQDLEAIAVLAKKHGIVTAIDNSYATALVQKPIAMGIDLVIYSATKYLAGHSDLVAGVICGPKHLMKDIFTGDFLTLGACISPFNAWLLLRSLRTLPLRIERSSRSVVEVIAFLEQHPAVEQVLFPFSEQSPQLELARKQMRMPMGLFSILLKTKEPHQIEAFCEKLQYFLMAVSWGGHESLVFPALAVRKAHPEAEIPVNLLRFYVGLEEPAVLIADLEAAFHILAD